MQYPLLWKLLRFIYLLLPLSTCFGLILDKLETETNPIRWFRQLEWQE